MDIQPIINKDQLNGFLGFGIESREIDSFKSYKPSDLYIIEKLTKKEIKYCFSKSNPSFYIAKIIAVKNAALKSAGTSEKTLPFCNIEVSFKKKPIIQFLNKNSVSEPENTFIFDSYNVSISRKKTAVTAVVVREKSKRKEESINN